MVAQNTKRYNPLEQDELENLIIALEHIEQIIGIDDTINKLVIYAEDPYGNPYKVTFRWNSKKYRWESLVKSL